MDTPPPLIKSSMADDDDDDECTNSPPMSHKMRNKRHYLNHDVVLQTTKSRSREDSKLFCCENHKK